MFRTIHRTGWLQLSLLLAVTGAWSKPMNPDTNWFQQAGYGVFVHYLATLQNNPEKLNSLGRETSWDDCLNEFDVDRFAQTMHEVGAGYVIFTVMQITRYLIAPNATYDALTGYAPGEACAQRDLIADLAAALGQYHIPLLLYYTGDGPRADPQAAKAIGCSPKVTPEFVRNWSNIAKEYSERYGEKVVGWWVDGCYPWIGYNDELLTTFTAALKAGNPRSLVAFNRGVDPKVMSYTPAEDYTCGEQNQFFDLPASRWLDGEQWHLLSFLGEHWGAPGCRYSKRDLAEYVFDAKQRGGVISIDVMLYRDGGLERSQVEVLKAVRAELREGRPRPPIPPGNLAYRKQAKLLSLDGSRELEVNSGTHFAKLGVDGKPGTYAQAGGEWPWTYEVDLIDTQPLRRIKLTFGRSYATQFTFQVSADHEQWQTVASVVAGEGQPYEATFEPVSARYVRVCASKPDGPKQPGGQMSVAELEVYE